MKNKGFTMIELLIVIVVMGIIAGFSVLTVSEVIHASQEKADINNLNTLNVATENYIMFEEANSTDAFEGINSDLDRITKLLTEGYIDIRVTPQQDTATFGWNTIDQEWQLFVDGNPYSEETSGYNFGDITIDDAINDGMYVYQENNITYDEDEGRLVFDPKKGKTLKSTSADEYSFTVRWSTENLNDARILFLFDYHDDTDLDKGEGFSILFRKNTNFVRLHTLTNGTKFSNPITFNYASSGIIPNYTVDDSWYGEVHTTKLVITRVNSTTKNVAIHVDGVYLTDFNYTQSVIGETVYYGVSNIKKTDSEAYVYSIN
ncbi:hypothetical protein KQ51_00110 [Candidatus Izimaplasma bacterium HR1]|jgi:prepilin-type N-terminal cleavage/methylation domain-containing protein|uniref:type II secretion system protein n=1 Tax=Candidatus Izimoplasma sp. HR1 TaxID=1541959 RepID=UPI0004F8289D|nr:hypothetical protein KQ51_00110 [Candidatus Izimaplasma bacterium HR1]